MLCMIQTADELPAGDGTWRNLEGPPDYGRFVFADDRAALGEGSGPAGATTWIGQALVAGAAPPPAGAGAVLAVGQEPTPGAEGEFDDWMTTEHVPGLASVDGTLWAARFEAVDGSPRFYAVYYLAGPEVCGSAPWRQASDTPWRNRMRGLTHNRVRGLFVPV